MLDSGTYLDITMSPVLALNLGKTCNVPSTESISFSDAEDENKAEGQ